MRGNVERKKRCKTLASLFSFFHPHKFFISNKTMASTSFHLVNHPLLTHKLSLLRDVTTSPKQVRELMNEIGNLLGIEATRDLDLPETKLVNGD